MKMPSSSPISSGIQAPKVSSPVVKQSIPAPKPSPVSSAATKMKTPTGMKPPGHTSAAAVTPKKEDTITSLLPKSTPEAKTSFLLSPVKTTTTSSSSLLPTTTTTDTSSSGSSTSTIDAWF